jgi:uncharacterized membrane protein
VVVLWLGSWRGLFDPGLWQDEAFTVHHSLRPLSELWVFITQYEPQMAGHYLLVHGMSQLADSDAWLRSASLLGMSLAVFASGVVVNHATGSRTIGVIAGVTVAIFPDTRFYAVDLRGYALAAGFIGAAALTLVMKPGPGLTWTRILAIGGFIGIAGTFNIFAILAWIPFGAATFFMEITRRRWILLGSGISLTALINAPFMPLLLSSSNEHGSWIDAIPVTMWPGAISRQFGWLDSLLLVSAVLLIATLSTRTRKGFRVARQDDRRLAVIFIALMSLAPLVILGILSELIRPLMVPKFLLFALPFALVAPITLLAPWWQTTLSRKTVARVLLVAIPLWTFSIWFWPPMAPRPEIDEFRPAVALVVAEESGADLAFTGYPNALVRYGLPVNRQPSRETRKIWRVDWGPHPESQIIDWFKTTASREGVTLTGLPELNGVFGAAYVWSAPVTVN